MTPMQALLEAVYAQFEPVKRWIIQHQPEFSAETHFWIMAYMRQIARYSYTVVRIDQEAYPLFWGLPPKQQQRGVFE